jgi:hypothetical protein
MGPHRSELREEAGELAVAARLEDISVRQSPLIKRNKKGDEKTYYRWLASWGSGKETKTVYLGSINKMSQSEALQKACRLKAEALSL